MPSGHLILHQNQNQAAWAVKFHLYLEAPKLSERCVLPKNAWHPSSSLQSRQRFMHWMRAEFWHNVVVSAAKAENQESCQAFRKGSRGGWRKTWKYQRFPCTRAWVSVQWREGASSHCDRLKPALALALLKIMWWLVPNSAGNQLWSFTCTSDHLSNS